MKYMPSIGRASMVNMFLNSLEFRGNVVIQLYGFAPAPAITETSLFYPALHRPVAPSAAEISGWVNMPLDLLTIEVSIVGSGEYFGNG